MPKKRVKIEPYDDRPLTAAEMKTARRLKDDPDMMAAVKRSLRGRPAGTAKKEAVRWGCLRRGQSKVPWDIYDMLTRRSDNSGT